MSLREKAHTKCNHCGKSNPADIHTCTPLALRLADAIEGDAVSPIDLKAAAELRRLHVVNEEMMEALEGCEAFLLSAGFASSDVYAEVCAAIAKATGEQA